MEHLLFVKEWDLNPSSTIVIISELTIHSAIVQPLSQSKTLSTKLFCYLNICNIFHMNAANSWYSCLMTPYIRALRAITATVFQRVYRPVAWIVGGILLLIWIGFCLLGGLVSHWWFLAFILIVPLTIVAVVAALVIWTLSKRLMPRAVTNGEREQILGFSDKVLRVAELRATPVPMMVFLIAKDLVRGKNSRYLEGVIDDSTSLKRDFVTIRDLFV